VILQYNEVSTTRDKLITLAIRLENVMKMRTQRNFIEKEKAKAQSFKPKTDSRAESSSKGGISASKNNSTSRRKRRGRGAGESTSGSKPAKPDANKFEKKRNLLQIIYFNCNKKNHLANIYFKSKKVSNFL
jgi:hypothetical protein